ncbi:MAG: DUF502 domain-containing protein [Syntrophorhabdaceae bacterium]|nr:DUF502 domain-containing protein [Syntrophorhabdaceae bacterium]
MVEKLKKSFITGLFVLLPLWLSIAIITWLFGVIDNLFVPLLEASLRRAVPWMPHIPGMGILTGLIIILILGLFARNVVGKRIVDAIERLIDRIPGYRQIYSTVKQLTNAFSSENKGSFKTVVLVEHPREGVYIIGFHTATVEHNGRNFAIVYFATNHLYLGDVFLFPEEKVVRLDMPADQAIRLLMSGGIVCPQRLNSYLCLEKEPPASPQA